MRRVEAPCWLGRMYYLPRIVTLMMWCLPIAAFGDYATGHESYLKGEFSVAFREFNPLAKEGNEFAQTSLGLMYEKGQGVLRDMTKAAHWYRKAAVKGNPIAQNRLGSLYARGAGVQEDYARSVYWFRRAAVQGNATAQNNLGIAYAAGQGVEKDLVLAYAWARLALSSGESKALSTMDYLRANMGSDQVAKATRLAGSLIERERERLDEKVERQ